MRLLLIFVFSFVSFFAPAQFLPVSVHEKTVNVFIEEMADLKLIQINKAVKLILNS
jgi:hypothetical protein